jgi:hypothetical protein
MFIQVVVWLAVLVIAAFAVWLLFALPDMLEKANHAVLEQAGGKKSLKQLDLQDALRAGPRDDVDPWSERVLAARVRAMHTARWSSKTDASTRTEEYHFEDPRGIFAARLVPQSYWHGTLHAFTLELRYAREHAAPDRFHLSIPEAQPMLAPQRASESSAPTTTQALFHASGEASSSERAGVNQTKTLKIPGYLTRTSLEYENVSLSGMAHPIYERCFASSTLEVNATESPVVLQRMDIQGPRVTIKGVVRSPYSPEWSLTPSLEKNRAHIMESAARLLVSLGESLAWWGETPMELVEGLSKYETHHDDRLRRQAREQYDAMLTPEQRRAVDIERILDRNGPFEERDALFARLIAQAPSDPALDRVFEASRDPDAARLRRIITTNAFQHLERRLKGPDRTDWLNAYFGEQGGAPRELVSAIARDITPASLLDPALSQRTREVLLGNILHIDGDGYMGGILEKLLEQSDEEQLIGLLRLLKEVGGKNTAEAIAKLARNPKQVDKTEEYVALISAIRAFYLTHTDVFAVKEIEVFLCSCLEHTEERVVLMVPSLLEVLGGAYTLRYVTTLLQQDARARLHAARLGKIVDAIRARGDIGGFAGGLSLAEQQGGELTITGEKGGLTQVKP